MRRGQNWLQWSRAFLSAEMVADFRHSDRDALLQWSRAFLSAEIPRSARDASQPNPASMEPRFFERGNADGQDRHVADHARFNGAALF